MSKTKIQVGYGTGQRGTNKKGLYANRSNGKLTLNGGFNGCPTVTYETITDDQWNKAFPNSYKPSWLKDESEPT
jgi:hypothetical protein